jgi:hypothetical protein
MFIYHFIFAYLTKHAPLWGLILNNYSLLIHLPYPHSGHLIKTWCDSLVKLLIKHPTSVAANST